MPRETDPALLTLAELALAVVPVTFPQKAAVAASTMDTVLPAYSNGGTLA